MVFLALRVDASSVSLSVLQQLLLVSAGVIIVSTDEEEESGRLLKLLPMLMYPKANTFARKAL